MSGRRIRGAGISAPRRMGPVLVAIVGAMLIPAVGAAAADSAIAGIWQPDASRSERFPRQPPFTEDGGRSVAEWRATHDPIEDDPGNPARMTLRRKASRGLGRNPMRASIPWRPRPSKK